MLKLRPLLTASAIKPIIPSTYRPAPRRVARLTRTMASETPTKRLKTDAPLIGTHK